MAKLIVLFVVSALCVAISDAHLSLLGIRAVLNHIEECREEVNASQSDPGSSHSHGCFLACFWQKAGVLDSSGKMSKELVHRAAQKYLEDYEDHKDTLDQIVDKCLAIEVSSDVCEAADQYTHCADDENLQEILEHDK